MNYKKLFGFGVIIWAVAYILSMALYAYKALDSYVGIILMIIVPAVVAYFLARNLRETYSNLLKYSIGWVIIGLILDLILTIPYTGFAIYSQWNYWLAYVLILIAPLFAGKKA